jgi:predicted SAM-dependent methyltransferase
MKKGKIRKIFKQTTRRLSWGLYRKNRLLHTKIQDLISNNRKLHIGCGLNKLKGYINVDITPLEGCDVVMDATDLCLVPADSIEEIKMQNVFEHFYRNQQNQALSEYRRVLQKGGKLIIEGLPNFDAIIRAYLDKEKGVVGPVFDLFNVYRLTHGEPEQGDASNMVPQLHKDIFTKNSIKTLLEETGFSVESIEDQKFCNEKNFLCMKVVGVKV